MNYDNVYFKYTVWILLVVSILFLVGQLSFIIDILGTILMITALPILLASFFYYLLRPLVGYLVEKKLNKTIAVFGVLLMVIAVIAAFSLFAGNAISGEFGSFYATLSEYIKEAPQKLETIFEQDKFWNISLEDIESRLLDLSQMVLETFRENIAGWITNIADVSAVIILIPIVLFFLLRDDKLFYKNIMEAVPKRHKTRIVGLMREIDVVLQNYFAGQLMVAGVLGVLTYIGYLIIGLPNALFLSIFSMVFSIIPFLGPLIGIIPAIFIGWTVSLFMVFKVILVLAVTQQLEGNVVRPKIMGNRLEIHPMLIIFLVVIAISLYGFLGAFFVIPLYATVRIIFKHIFKEAKEKDNLVDGK
ncbi:AI-2E family transporter [Gudongella sp. DL1XJH-153]|uniref:AI-2E family transporter n=1 Tax=Gudongella sp. DL1XJH-153 TaxID=3409804 RepID=UPI003BB6F1A8